MHYVLTLPFLYPVLCAVSNSTTEKNIVTRALWCLSNQNFHSAQICQNVPRIVTFATDIILSHGFGSLAVEALGVYTRIHQQCPKEFGLVASLWYKGILVILHCKVAKFQRKALALAVEFESLISSNVYLLGYLSKELKDKILSTLVGYMDERGKDPILILNMWSHFVSVLGVILHKHSAFLNEMLRVVEMVCIHIRMYVLLRFVTYCIVLYPAVLYCTLLCCIVLYYAALFCIVLYYAVLCCIVLYYAVWR